MKDTTMTDFIETMNGSFIRKSDIKQVYIEQSNHSITRVPEHFTPVVLTKDNQRLIIGNKYTSKSKAKIAVNRFMLKNGLIKRDTDIPDEWFANKLKEKLFSENK